MQNVPNNWNVEEKQIQVFTPLHLNGADFVHSLIFVWITLLLKARLLHHCHHWHDFSSEHCDGSRNVGNVEKRSGGVLGSPILTLVHTWQLKCQVRKVQKNVVVQLSPLSDRKELHRTALHSYKMKLRLFSCCLTLPHMHTFCLYLSLFGQSVMTQSEVALWTRLKWLVDSPSSNKCTFTNVVFIITPHEVTINAWMFFFRIQYG